MDSRAIPQPESSAMRHDALQAYRQLIFLTNATSMETFDAWVNAKPATAHFRPDRLCRTPSWRRRDCVSPGRRRHSSVHLQRLGRASPPGGQCPGCPEARLQRPGSHAGLEWLPPLRAVLRRQWIGACAAHHQPAAASGPDRLDRQPRRRPGAVFRPELSAAGAGGARQMQHHQALHRAVRRRQATGRFRHSESAEL